MSQVAYASRLARLPVLAPDGGTVGVIADIVVGAPVGSGPPPVYGLVATVPGRRIFVAAGRVADIDAEGVRLRSGALNLRRFTKRPSETLVLAELIDQPIDDGRHINDLGIGRSPRRATTWEVTTVDLVIGSARGRFARRHRQHQTAGPEALRPLLGETNRHHQLRDMHPADAAERLVTLQQTQRVAVAQSLDDEQLADLIEELPHEVKAELLTALGVERGTDVLEAMEPDDAADILGDLEPDGRATLLAAMEGDNAAMLRRLLVYGDDTAGGLMNPEPIACTPDTTVAEALARLRDPDIVPAMATQVYVVEAPTQTPTGEYRGTCGIQRLLREPPGRRMRSCVDQAPEPLEPSQSVDEVARHLAVYNLIVAPTVDDQGRLLGAVTVDDVLDHILPDGWRQR